MVPDDGIANKPVRAGNTLEDMRQVRPFRLSAGLLFSPPLLLLAYRRLCRSSIPLRRMSWCQRSTCSLSRLGTAMVAPASLSRSSRSCSQRSATCSRQVCRPLCIPVRACLIPLFAPGSQPTGATALCRFRTELRGAYPM